MSEHWKKHWPNIHIYDVIGCWCSVATMFFYRWDTHCSLWDTWVLQISGLSKHSYQSFHWGCAVAKNRYTQYTADLYVCLALFVRMTHVRRHWYNSIKRRETQSISSSFSRLSAQEALFLFDRSDRDGLSGQLPKQAGIKDNVNAVTFFSRISLYRLNVFGSPRVISWDGHCDILFREETSDPVMSRVGSLWWQQPPDGSATWPLSHSHKTQWPCCCKNQYFLCQRMDVIPQLDTAVCNCWKY